MLSKITAQFVIISFVTLTLVAILLRYALGIEFSLQIYFQYLLLFSIIIVVLGKPFIKLGIDLMNQPFKENVDHFKIPGSDLPKNNQSKES